MTRENLSSGNKEVYRKIAKILKLHQRLAFKFCSAEGQAKLLDKGKQPTFWPMSPKTGAVVLSLGETLFAFVEGLYIRPDGYTEISWGSSPFINERLHEAGYCIRDIPIFKAPQTSVDGDYYFSFLRSPRAGLDHSDCSKIGCKGKVADTSTYTTVHKPGCDDQEKPFVHAPDAVEKIVENGGIPIIRWKNGTLECYGYDPDKMTRYVAISHVFVLAKLPCICFFR